MDLTSLSGFRHRGKQVEHRSHLRQFQDYRSLVRRSGNENLAVTTFGMIDAFQQEIDGLG
jgi:hypothetical protein